MQTHVSPSELLRRVAEANRGGVRSPLNGGDAGAISAANPIDHGIFSAVRRRASAGRRGEQGWGVGFPRGGSRQRRARAGRRAPPEPPRRPTSTPAAAAATA
jgi:hypothetical protein